ncbi:TPA: helix-turn-helix transcriptional regulator [Streptococcus pyogenes]|uniref:helix-turn-helix domain-containing protein n=1 Tax=Streptococcus pyogenes TaxID=1314 RepID=UPI001881F811|nr:helix-turn-helix transcriptional regulator [Streptococcus pyogenes]HEP1546979.1 helix-turn-helix transcriptional regulator [Streptococcus pyogenes]HEQ0480921.1 helix-turn-helix transcriptional regulator [Streptococcus pyogenes]HEQ0970253.1 helix-turn-helix transcriptional regulator [Streptococcus pyogenes]HEQ0975788.1 helix-turn-helix transcriptional regulator [Streptococcus pyogenes]HEQ4365096.1 helix-turn-helix transcriptional regulator [Streptococcus pyogenes]
MKFFEENYSQEIPTRIKNLRKKHNITQSELGNAGQVSQVESGKRPITSSMLVYLNALTASSYTYIVFGELDEFIENLFHYFFSSILYRDLEAVHENLYSFMSDDLISIQSSCLSIAKTFANFNIQRKRFMISTETEMDTFHKKDDIDVWVGGKSYNPARSFRNNPINELTVIDFEEMADILFLTLRDNLIRSFEINVCNTLFELDKNGVPTTFNLDKIDSIINKWWSENVSTEIIPNLIKKLRENPLFNIGFMVNDILERMYKENIPKSYLTSVPLVISQKGRTTSSFSMTGGQQIDEVKFKQISEDYMKLLSQGKDITELYQKYSKEELANLGINIYQSNDIERTEERTFDEIISWVSNPYATRPIQERHTIQLEPTRFSLEDKKRIEKIASQGINDIDLVDLVELYDINLDNTNVTRYIEGLLTNNTQVTYYFQEQLNEELLAMASALDRVQQAFIKLLSEEEIRKFAL